MSAHESLGRETEVEGSSNRSFGWVFTAFFLILALLPLLGGGGVRYWALAASAGMAAVTLVRPSLLEAPNRLWGRFGLWLGRIVSPVMTGVVFYGVVTPIGLLMRLVGKDVLRLRRDPAATSYWIVRDPPGPPPQSMSDQF
ncbi:MAG: SxtJ family membrane protein [Gammaproteobacteria bacterium]|jgi:hypothetical protein|nr:SxtJ family membrane protein [Gammaproteobacteria bacterium]